jgi:hypothetical protein
MIRSAPLLAVALLALTLGPSGRAEESARQAEALARIRALHASLTLAPRDSYLNYAIATIARREGLDLRRAGIEFPLVPVVTGDPAQRTDLLAIATGADAIGESLQLTNLTNPEGWPARGSVRLDRLTPPRVPAMELEAPAEGPRDAEAALAPRDWLFVRFTDGKALVEFGRELRLWADHVETFYRRDGRVPVDLAAVLGRLGLPDPAEAAALYAGIGEPVAGCPRRPVRPRGHGGGAADPARHGNGGPREGPPRRVDLRGRPRDASRGGGRGSSRPRDLAPGDRRGARGPRRPGGRPPHVPRVPGDAQPPAAGRRRGRLRLPLRRLRAADDRTEGEDPRVPPAPLRGEPPDDPERLGPLPPGDGGRAGKPRRSRRGGATSRRRRAPARTAAPTAWSTDTSRRAARTDGRAPSGRRPISASRR